MTDMADTEDTAAAAETALTEAHLGAGFEAAIANSEAQNSVYQNDDATLDSVSGVQRESRPAPATPIDSNLDGGSVDAFKTWGY